MKRRKNILAVLLAVTVMATAMPGSAIAAPVDGQTTEVSVKAGTEKAADPCNQHYGSETGKRFFCQGNKGQRYETSG